MFSMPSLSSAQLHNFVSAREAAELLRLAEPLFARSATVRSTGDEKRTSSSAALPSSSITVSMLRDRIAAYSGTPTANVESLQVVRYYPGERYAAHHDYDNACDSWHNGNRHFTFLLYLSEVAEGGETTFPMLDLVVTPVRCAARPETPRPRCIARSCEAEKRRRLARRYAALVFNNCLDNGEPDERTQHAALPPTRSVKCILNGWVRARAARPILDEVRPDWAAST